MDSNLSLQIIRRVGLQHPFFLKTNASTDRFNPQASFLGMCGRSFSFCKRRLFSMDSAVASQSRGRQCATGVLQVLQRRVPLAPQTGSQP